MIICGSGVGVGVGSGAGVGAGVGTGVGSGTGIKGPFGAGALILSMFVPLGLATFFSIAYKGRTKKTYTGKVKIIKPRKKAIVTLKDKEKIDLFEESKGK